MIDFIGEVVRENWIAGIILCSGIAISFVLRSLKPALEGVANVKLANKAKDHNALPADKVD